MKHLSSSSAADDQQQVRAFEELYRQEIDRVYRYLYFRLGNVEDTQDITAQTFLAAWQHFPGFRGESKVSTWLLGIARHKLNDHLRSAAFARDKETLPIETVAEQPDREPSTLDTVLGQLQIEEIARLLCLLPADRADALALRLFAGMRASEIADLLGKSEAAVKMLVMRGLDELKWRISHNE